MLAANTAVLLYVYILHNFYFSFIFITMLIPI